MACELTVNSVKLSEIPTREKCVSAGHLLVVEDDEFVQSLLAAYLEKEGFKVWRAMNGREMLCLLTQERIDLILLDLTLPDEDGLTLAIRCAPAR